jgi:crotonobetainyl-CoA:carnitine CoA-transferase CaiB-like acyl-CoA transferase
MVLPLDGIRILDLSRLLPGPFASMLLADFGAEVIKVEDPFRGDYVRWRTPYLTKGEQKESATFLALNRIFYELAKTADVILETFRPGVVSKLKIDYETIRQYNQEIIYCALTGFGQNGPYRDLPGHDVNYLGVGGVASLTGTPDQPELMGVQVADIGAGALNAVIAILMGLLARKTTGKGQYIDVAMLDGAMCWLVYAFPRYWASQIHPTRGRGRLSGGRPGYGIYKTKDAKFIAVGALEEKFWRNLCTTIKREDLINAHQPNDTLQEEVKNALTQAFLTKTRKEWFDLAKKVDICLTPVYDLEEILKDPQVQAREMFIDFEDPRVGTIKYLGMPFKLSETPGSIRMKSPGYGEHTDAILKSLNFSEERISDLHSKGVISPKHLERKGE